MQKTFLILLFCCMLPLLNGAELNNSIMSVSTKGNEFCELKYRNGKIIDGASFALTVDGKTSNLDKYPGNSVRSALGDYPFIKFSGSMPQADFKGKISFPGNSEMSYELNAELKDKLTGQAFFYAWLPSANLNGCKYEYLKNDRWESGFLGGKNNPRVSLNGWSVLKLYTRDKLVIEITCEAGYACLVRWDSAKKEKQAFRLTIFPNNKTTGKKSHLPQNFKIAYSVKVTPDTGNGIDSDREVADCAVIGNKTAVKSGTLLLVPVSELTGKIKFNGLSGFKVSCNGKELRSQLEDRNLNNKVDKYDLLVIEPEAQDSVKWKSMRITGIYKQSAPVFSKLSGRKYTEDNIYFEELSTTSYSVGVAGSGKLALKIPSRYIDAPVNPDALNIPDGIFMTKGKLRIRIDSVFRHNDIPITRSFAYNLKDKTVTYSTAIWTLNGWTKHFVEISPSGKNYLPAIAYMYGDICFGNNPAFFYGDYGDVLSGLYKPADFSGFSCGILAEQLKGNAWSPRAGVRGDLFSLFYTPIASSFYGKIQLAFNGGKKDFNAAVDRCKSKYDLDFYHDAAKLNRKLDSDKQALAGVSAQCKQVEHALDALKQAGLYTASLEIDLGTVKSWARAAEIDLNKCHLQRLSQRVAKINATLEKIRLNIKTVEDRQIKLQVPEGETKFYFGVVEGTKSILERDFKERYINPARYVPLQIAGIKNVQYHSFCWNDKIDAALSWINMLRGIGMNGYALLGMEHSPGFIDKYPEYIKFCDNFKQTNELRPFSPLFHKYFKGCEKLTAEIKTLFRSYGRRLATETETDLIFGINEPTPLHMLYEGAYKTTFIYGMRNYLKARYKNIAALNQAWNSSFKSFEDVQWDNAFLTEKFTHQGQQYLDGIWEFKEDPRNEGISKKWFASPPAQLRKINVPGYWERQIPALKDYNGIAWYFKHINLKAGKYRLTFKAIDDNAVVYLNGHKIASNNGFNKEFSVVPVGLINTSWGGTRIEPWIAAEGFKRIPELKKIFRQVNSWNPTSKEGKKNFLKYIEDMKLWLPDAEVTVRNGKMPAEMPVVPGGNNTLQSPTMIFNAMVNPIVKYGIKGVLWYQGESNGYEGEIYTHKMNALISSWRALWKQGNFPFYFVQLANYQTSNPNNPAGGDGWAKLREAQLKTLSFVPNTGMAVIIDIGEADDIHPKDKQDVGKRLAAWALKKDYNKDVVFSGPLFKNYKVEGNKVVISFDHTGSGLTAGIKNGIAPLKETPNAKLKWFAIAGADKRWYWGDAVIVGDKVIVSSDKVKNPVAVRYAYTMNPKDANLYNKEGFPASPFRTDN